MLNRNLKIADQWRLEATSEEPLRSSLSGPAAHFHISLISQFRRDSQDFLRSKRQGDGGGEIIKEREKEEEEEEEEEEEKERERERE